jgi:5-methylcytosine-specific restriction endonuclease McrA
VADEVDHITRLGLFRADEREAARFDATNVQSLCRPCHARKTCQEAAEVRAIHRAQDRTGQLW